MRVTRVFKSTFLLAGKKRLRDSGEITGKENDEHEIAEEKRTKRLISTANLRLSFPREYVIIVKRKEKDEMKPLLNERASEAFLIATYEENRFLQPISRFASQQMIFPGLMIRICR